MPLDTLAAALGVKVADLQQQLADTDDPGLRRRLERRAEATRRRLEDRDDREWLDQITGEARTRFEAIRTLTDAELAQRRHSQNLGAWVDQALADAELLTSVAAASMDGAGGGHGKPGARGPGFAAGGLYEPALQVGPRYRAVIEQMVANLQREIDACVRRPLDRRLESSDDKERRLFERWEGVRSEVVATLDPSLGSARTVEIMRRRRGLRPVDGSPLPASRRA